MKKYAFILFGAILFIFFACKNDEDATEKLMTNTFLFADGFETENNELDELFPSNGSRWSNVQQTDPSTATNEIAITDTRFTEGKNALRIVSYQSDSELSKIYIEKGGLDLKVGDKLTINADFYITGTQSLENLLLIDVECCSCWDPMVGDNFGSENQCPGVRLMMSGDNDYLSIERGKISAITLQQTVAPFPRDQWVAVQWEMVLSDTDNGDNRLLINGNEVINTKGMNMPNKQVFKEVFANEGIDFSLKDPITYERIQIGVTANPTAATVELFIDNFAIKVARNN